MPVTLSPPGGERAGVRGRRGNVARALRPPAAFGVRATSDVELEVDHVAVAHDVLLAFERQLGVGAAGGF